MKKWIKMMLPRKVIVISKDAINLFKYSIIANMYRKIRDNRKFQKQIDILCEVFGGKEILGDNGLISIDKSHNIKQDNDINKDKKDTCLLFILDSNFIKAFTALLYSLHKEESLVHLPIVILTNDRKIYNDKFVNEVAERVVFIDEDDLRVFSEMSNKKVPEKYRLKYAPKYTFLKFFAFRDYGYKNHIYLDCDMLCLNNANNLLDYCGKVDFAATPVIPMYKFYHQNKRAVSQEVAEKAYEDFFFHGYPPAERLNSGVMVIGERFIGDDVFYGLVTLAKTEPFSKEQDVTYQYLHYFQGLQFEYLPQWFNVYQTLLEIVGRNIFYRNFENIVMIHYLTNVKPWKMNIFNESMTWLDSLWWEYYVEAVEYFKQTNDQ